MELRREQLIHKGKANNVFSTNAGDILELEASDRISAGNGERRDVIEGKGVVNNVISMYCFKLLEKNGIKTHFISEGSNECSKFVKKLDMIMLEVINRRYTAGSFCERFGCEAGVEIVPSGVEFSLKSDELGDPFIPKFAIKALGIATEEEIQYMEETTAKVSDILSEYFDSLGVRLIDFKIEFGRDMDGNIVIGDEISPDTCRLVDKVTGEKFDKDLFRQNLGGVGEAYRKILERVKG
ncbi:MAG: phosphoribosylaminoimidazolesuccinocarboxamide synthase [Clostridia bacterium]|nr:phosphoribosylaminoimidazolesuccinocarboxamide synthase [Clostridia bacterium]